MLHRSQVRERESESFLMAQEELAGIQMSADGSERVVAGWQPSRPII